MIDKNDCICLIDNQGIRNDHGHEYNACFDLYIEWDAFRGIN